MRSAHGIFSSSNNLTVMSATNQNASEVGGKKTMHWFPVAKSNEKDAGRESGIELSEHVDLFQKISEMSQSELLNRLTAESFWGNFDELGKLYSIPNIKFDKPSLNTQKLFRAGERQILKEFYISAQTIIEKVDIKDKMKLMLKLIKVMEQLECWLDLSEYGFPIKSQDFITLGLVANLIDLLPKNEQNSVLQHLANSEKCGKVFWYLRHMPPKDLEIKEDGKSRFGKSLTEAFKLFAGENATTPKIAEVLLKIILFSKDTSPINKYEQALSKIGNLDLIEIKKEVYGNYSKNQSKSLHLQQEMGKID